MTEERTAPPLPRACSSDDVSFLHRAIVAYNASRVPFTQDEPFIAINLAIENEGGGIAAGIISELYCWGCLYVDTLWVDERFRGRGYGAHLLAAVEERARALGCSLVHLDTFDFQAKDFYLKHGYTVFGELDACPPGHTRYFLKKALLADAVLETP